MNSRSIAYRERPNHPEMRAMAFVNEYATEEDYRKFDLNRLWDEYHPFQKGEFYWGGKASFTIDRARNTFLMEVSRGGSETPSGVSVLLWIDGQKVLVHLKQAEGSSPKLSTKPFHLVWDFVSMRPARNASVSPEKVLNFVKLAMSVYGFAGLRKQIPETVVSFNF